jgi:hypothetical protein
VKITSRSGKPLSLAGVVSAMFRKKKGRRVGVSSTQGKEGRRQEKKNRGHLGRKKLCSSLL